MLVQGFEYEHIKVNDEFSIVIIALNFTLTIRHLTMRLDQLQMALLIPDDSLLHFLMRKISYNPQKRDNFYPG